MSSADNLVAFVTFLIAWPAIKKMKRSSSQNWYESEYCEKTEALSDRCDDDWDETALKAACFALAWLGSCLIISQLGHWTTAHSNCCVLVVQNRSKSLRAICKVCSTQLTPVSAHSAPWWTLYLESLSTTDDLIMSEMAPKRHWALSNISNGGNALKFHLIFSRNDDWGLDIWLCSKSGGVKSPSLTLQIVSTI